MKRALLGFFLFSAAVTGRAGEVGLYYLPSMHVQYEGTGFREVANGWELKVKPQGPGGGLRWRQEIGENWDIQTQYWRNKGFYSWEDGNAQSSTQRQTGQTKLSLQSLWVDARTPLAGSNIRAVFGLHGVYETFDRKDIIFNGVPEPGTARETVWGSGLHAGFWAGSRSARANANGFFWEGEALLGHLFWTGNDLEAGGGSIHKDGYTYHFLLRGGYTAGPFRFSAGALRQLFQVTVPGGKTLPSGAAVSLPINKTDVFSPFLALSWMY